MNDRQIGFGSVLEIFGQCVKICLKRIGPNTGTFRFSERIILFGIFIDASPCVRSV